MSGRHPALGIALIPTMAACLAALPVRVILWSQRRPVSPVAADTVGD